jgi:hypothetical protein
MTDPTPLNYESTCHRSQPKLHIASRLLIGMVVDGMITFPAMLLAALSVGDHHPGELTANLLYPFAMLSAGLNSPPHFSADAIAIAIVQFPFYGAVIGAIFRRRHSWIGVLVLICIHGVAATLCITGIFHY